MTPSLWPVLPSPWIMGILNVTPDSFSDGGQNWRLEDALATAERLIAEGADILDVGGESTRPGAEPIPPEEQIQRVVPVIRAIRSLWAGPISIDTRQAAVAEAALNAGANWINDISAMRDDPAMVKLAAEQKCTIVLMHMQGAPGTMQENPRYEDVVTEVAMFLKERADYAQSCGIKSGNIILDPGIGFGKSVEHNLSLLRRLSEVVGLGLPVLVGASRKSFIGHITGASVGDRLAGSLICALRAVEAGASIVRVHDVGPTRQALAVAAVTRAQT